MEFRRNASERRRRVLIEENLQENSSATAIASAARSKGQQAPLQRYSEAAQRAHQPHLTDLLPKRRWSLTVLGLFGLIVITSFVALYGVFFVQPLPIAVMDASAFDLARTDSLSGWFMGACLAYASHVALIIYLVRRHRVDDYRGRYRVWLWFAGLLLLASVESLAGMRYAAAELVHQSVAGGLSMSAWSVLLAGSLPALALVRATMEIRRSWGACILLSLAATFYIFVGVQQSFDMISAGPLHTILVNTALLLGHYAMLSALVIYARYVYLDAHGCLTSESVEKAPRKKQRAKKTEDKETKSAESRRRSDLDKPALETKATETKAAEKKSTEVPAAEKKPSATITAAGSRPLRVDAPHAPAASESDRRLSKAERKKLKRQMQS